LTEPFVRGQIREYSGLNKNNHSTRYKMNSNDNEVYVVKCTNDNLEDVLCMLKMSARVLHVDSVSCCIKTFSIDSIMKRRLTDAGASFWQEPEYVVAKAAAGRRL